MIKLILSKQGSIFLENQLSKQAELSRQGENISRMFLSNIGKQCLFTLETEVMAKQKNNSGLSMCKIS